MLLQSIKLFSKEWKSSEVNTVLAALAAQSINISVGLCQGYSAILLPQISDNSDISPEMSSWIASMGIISNPLGAILAAMFLDVIGRKLLLQSIIVPNLVGWILIAFSGNYIELCIGRFITGMTIGMATASYIYVAEITKPSNRSFLSAIGPVLVSLGILLVYVLGSFVHWKKVASVCAGVTLVTPFLMHLVPESPMWLYSKEKKESALAALTWLRGDRGLAKEELKVHEVQLSKAHHENNSLKGKMTTLSKRNVLIPLVVLLFFFMFQELSGIYIILYYSVDFFREAGTNINEYTASMIVGVLRLVMGVFGAYLINRYNRRTLAVSSGVLLGFTMLGAAILTTIDMYPTMKLVFILLHVCASMVGFLQLPWIMSGEMYPQNVRGTMAGFTASCGYIFIFLNIKTYPAFQETVTYNGALYMFSCFGFMGAAYCMVFLTETQGKSLTEITNGFSFKEKSAKDVEANGETETKNTKRVELVRF